MSSVIKFDFFKERVNKPCNVAFNSAIHKVIYNWYKYNKDQRNLVPVEGLNYNYNNDEIKELNRFGIVDAETPGGVVSRETLIFLSLEELPNFDIVLKKFCKDNLPNGELPSYYILEDTVETLDEYTDINDIVTEDAPGIRILNPPTHLLKAKTDKAVLEELISKHRNWGFTNFVDITSDIESIEHAFDTDNIDTIKRFNGAIDKIVSQATPKTVFYSTIENMCYVNVAAHLNYFYGITCMFKNLGGKFRLALGNLCYSPTRMMADDKLKYLQSFPTFTMKATDYSSYIAVTIARKVKVTVTMCDCEKLETGEVIVQDLDLDDPQLELLSIEELYNFRVGDNERAKLKSENERLKQLYIKFHRRLEGVTIPPNPCNTVFAKHKGTGVTYLCYIGSDEHINFSTQTLVMDMGLQFISKYEIRLSEVSSWIPLELCSDYHRYSKFAADKLLPVLKKDIRENEVRARLETKPITSLFRGFYMNRSNKTISGAKLSDFIEACLNCEDSVKFRIANGQSILEKLSIGEELQAKLNCFSCHDIILDEVIKVSEKTFARKLNY